MGSAAYATYYVNERVEMTMGEQFDKEWYEWKGEVNTRLANIEEAQAEIKEMLKQLKEDIGEMRVREAQVRTKLATVVGVVTFALTMLGKWVWAKLTGAG